MKNGKPTNVEIEQKQIKEEIEETRRIIKDFANQGLYSVNCQEVKFLYRRLRELEGREIIETQDNYEPIFIDGSDVPMNGRYE